MTETLYEEARILDEHALRAARKNFFDFCLYVDETWVPAQHHRVMCDALQAWGDGDIPFLVMTMAPRHGKSEILSRKLPAYMFGRYNDTRIIAASFGVKLAAAFNRDVQRIICSERYQKIFPHVKLNAKNMRGESKGTWLRNNEMFEVVDTKMAYRCAGIGSSLVGFGGNALILDDFIRDWRDANSKVNLENQWDWFRSVFLTRRSKNARVAITVTRWTHDDIVGRFLRMMKELGREDDVTCIDMPAIKDNAKTWYDQRNEGEALWPDFMDAQTLQETRNISGSRIFESLYQQRPTVLEGDIVKREWWKYYTDAKKPKVFDFTCISCDLTFDDESRNNDFVVMQVWGRVGAQKYLITQVRDRMSFTRTLSVLWALQEEFQPNAIYVEKAANGAAVVDTLKRKLSGVVAIKVGTSKAVRLEGCAPQIEAGQVFLPTNAPWLGTYIEEFAEFPQGAHDDQVDSTSMALNRMAKQKTVFVGPAGVTRRNPIAHMFDVMDDVG